MAMQINCPILRDGFVYGFDENVFKCLKLQDGSEQWQDKSLGKGSLMMSADGRLIITSEKGELVDRQGQPAEIRRRGPCPDPAEDQVLDERRSWRTAGSTPATPRAISCVSMSACRDARSCVSTSAGGETPLGME